MKAISIDYAILEEVTGEIRERLAQIGMISSDFKVLNDKVVNIVLNEKLKDDSNI